MHTADSHIISCAAVVGVNGWALGLFFFFSFAKHTFGNLIAGQLGQ